jgi:hypothetical protein
VKWLKTSPNLFYAFHWYSGGTPTGAIQIADSISKRWNMPALMTEFGSCSVKVPAQAAGIGWSYWEYANYCDTAPSPACLPGGKCDFGACITGW